MGQPVVDVRGSGPAAEAVEAAVLDVDASVRRIDSVSADDADLFVLVDRCGSSAFSRAQTEVDSPWIAVELGGVGGLQLPSVDAAVSVLDPGGGCFRCLHARVRANAPEEERTDGLPSKSDARLAGAVGGRLSVSLLAGEIGAGRLFELPYAEREFLPVPGCTCDTGPARHAGLDTSDEAVDIEEAADRAEGSIDGRVGIVREIGEVHTFPAPYYLATLCDTTTFADARAGPQAAGVAIDWNHAFVKAIGEALERYSAGVYRKASFDVHATADVTDAVSPDTFVLSPAYDDPDPTEPIQWIRGESITEGEGVWLPAEFVVFPPPTRRHAPSITTGLGLGTSGVDALLSGLTEVIERDATMLAWYSTFEPLGLRVDDAGFDELAKRARSEDLAVTTLLVTQDVDVPVVTVAIHRETTWPRFAVGSDADLDPAAAARSALAEALQNWMELRAMGPERAAEDASAIGRYAEFPAEARSFVDVGTTVAADDLGPPDLSSRSDELGVLAERLGSVGLTAYAARLTPRDVARLGFEAVRVLVPEAQPLFTGERFFGERARRVPRELGFRPRLDRAHHPYP